MQFAQGYARRRKRIYAVKRCGFSHFPAEGRTFLRTLGAQRTSVRASVKKEQFLYWLWFEKQNEIGRVNVPST